MPHTQCYVQLTINKLPQTLPNTNIPIYLLERARLEATYRQTSAAEILKCQPPSENFISAQDYSENKRKCLMEEWELSWTPTCLTEELFIHSIRLDNGKQTSILTATPQEIIHANTGLTINKSNSQSPFNSQTSPQICYVPKGLGAGGKQHMCL